MLHTKLADVIEKVAEALCDAQGWADSDRYTGYNPDDTAHQKWRDQARQLLAPLEECDHGFRAECMYQCGFFCEYCGAKDPES